MSQHHTKNTLECTKYCKRCGRMTRHNVSGHREGHCLECGMKPEAYEPGPEVYLERACICLAYPFAHLHNSGGRPVIR